MRASLYVLAAGILVGVVWRSLFSIDLWGVAAIILILASLGFVFRGSMFHHLLYVVLFLSALLLGLARTEFAHQTFEANQVFAEGAHVELTGVVVREPDVREYHTILYVDTDGTQTVRFKVNVPHYPAYGYGDLLLLSGTVEHPVSFETETGRVFDYPGYLKKDGVHYVLSDATVEAAGTGGGSTVTRTLLALKHEWLGAVSQLLPEPNASLLGGLVVGAKRSLGDEWLEAFRDTGIIHIVVLSGYNLTLVANSIVRATTFLPRTVGLGAGIAGIVAFAVMVGGGATVVRASVMGVLGMLAAYINRPNALMRMLTIAAVAMVLWNPFVLLYDPGFQLSFLATLGLIYGVAPIEVHLGFITVRFGLRGIVAATLATQLAVLPLLLYQVGSVSLVAPLVNVLVLPVVPLVMFVGFIAGLIGLVSLTLALPFAWLAHMFLSYIFLVVGFFSHMPFDAVTLPDVPLFMLAALYGVLYVAYRLFAVPEDG
jgi:competence protein ComEC